jgi:predicted nucleotidyltransferase component of viral defense system
MTIDDHREFRREVILALFSDNVLMQQLVLKGGNLLDIVYGISTRPSRDIDLSICGEIEDLVEFRSIMEAALRRWFEPRGYVVFDVTIREEPRAISDDVRDFWGGYKVEFKIVTAETHAKYAEDLSKLRVVAEAVVDEAGKKFPIDISKYEYIDEKVPELVDDFVVYTYSPPMFVAEKLRAICQQMPEYVSLLRKHKSMRGRDFLDIHTVAEHFRVDFGSPQFHDTLRKVFQAKHVDLRLLSKIPEEETREFHRQDFLSTADTVRPDSPLERYDFYFDYVGQKCQELEALWNV